MNTTKYCTSIQVPNALWRINKDNSVELVNRNNPRWHHSLMTREELEADTTDSVFITEEEAKQQFPEAFK